jgi:hypothetical protein
MAFAPGIVSADDTCLSYAPHPFLHFCHIPIVASDFRG